MSVSSISPIQNERWNLAADIDAAESALRELAPIVSPECLTIPRKAYFAAKKLVGTARDYLEATATLPLAVECERLAKAADLITSNGALSAENRQLRDRLAELETLRAEVRDYEKTVLKLREENQRLQGRLALQTVIRSEASNCPMAIRSISDRRHADPSSNTPSPDAT